MTNERGALIEVLARAIIEAQGYSPSENELARARDEVPGIITALTEAGYAIVPIEPSEAMLAQEPCPAEAEGIWQSMVKAGAIVAEGTGE